MKYFRGIFPRIVSDLDDKIISINQLREVEDILFIRKLRKLFNRKKREVCIIK